MEGLFGVTGCCRIWILGYADLARPLYQILKKAQKYPQSFIEWDDKSENAFHQLKKSLMTAPALGLTVQGKFQLYVCEKGGMNGLGSGDSSLGHHSPVSRLLKQRIRSGSQGMARMC
jgi:hypothetical protein